MILKRITAGITAFSFALVSTFAPLVAMANPQDGVVSSGSATITEAGKKLDVVQHTSKAVIDWRSFDIAVDEHTQFYQPGSGSIALNRVNSTDPSSILGKLSANGKVILINPNGVFFGANSVVDVSGMVASTADISNADFMNNSVLNFNIAGNADAKIINEGLITAGDAGLIGLVAPQIENSGIIRANLGKVALASGDSFTLDMYGDKLIEVAVNNDIATQMITNSGTITADGGSVLITAAASGIVDSIIDISGDIGASAYMGSDGEIILEAKGDGTNTGRNTVLVSGDLNATGITMEGNFVENVGNLTATNVDIDGYNVSNQGAITADSTIAVDYENLFMDSVASTMTASEGYISLTGAAGSANFISGTYDVSGTVGGNIDMFASNINLFGATLDATGESAGGKIRVGGDYQGTGDMLKAKTTTINQHTTIDASAKTDGDGGTAIVWSEDKTKFAGNIYAKGGATGGDGGLIEISSKGILEIFTDKAADASAAFGIDGQVLLDPKNIIISNAGSSSSLDFFSFADPNADTGSFGGTVVSLSNGNVVITDRQDDFAANDAGAVYLFNGATGALISTLRGSTASDNVGVGGVTALTNGNYVVSSRVWDNGGAVDAGAVTWGSGTTGVSGTISAANSLVGSTANDNVGVIDGITALSNGNYVSKSVAWDNGGIVNAGAATWGNGNGGTVGAVSAANSLVGSTAGDVVGGVVTALSNGNYIVSSSPWDNGGATDAGAVTWGNGTTGIVGAVSAANSLVGSTASDLVGGGLTELTNGNYVVSSFSWDNGGATDAGAVTWADGTTGITGAVSAANSLVGTQANDRVSSSGVTALTNGNYVVGSTEWDNGGVADAGAATWGDGTGGTVGAVSAANSLVGSTASDFVGLSLTALTNGNYVVSSLVWDDGGTANVGHATWGNGTTGIVGTISAANSLIGSTANDNIGRGALIALTNGNYVVGSRVWNNGGATDAGAVTWGNGTTGTVGVVSAANSLVGTTASDNIGNEGITALTNGNYVVNSRVWNNGGATDAGAVTWGDGNGGTVGAVSAANSLVGSTASDLVGTNQVIALSNGNYVVASGDWNNGGATDAGAVTWGDGTGGTVGAVSAANSLVGSTASDQVGATEVTALSNGNYIVEVANWDDGATVNAGAFTFGDGTTGVSGVIDSSNSIIGSQANAGASFIVLEDTVNGRYIVKFTNAQEVYSGDIAGGSLGTGFSNYAGADVNLNPAFLTNTLDTGSNLTLQANNDITITDAITVNNGAGDGGKLTLQAGRSILINADVTTDNGDIDFIGNETVANGVVAANRDAGNAEITMAGGTNINAGTGDVSIQLRDGAGKTNRTSGDISLRDITANTILANNSGTGGDVVLNGTLTAAGAGNSIVLASKKNFINNTGASALSTGAGRFLIYSTNSESDTPGGLSGSSLFGKTFASNAPGSIGGSGNTFLYADSEVVPTIEIPDSVQGTFEAPPTPTISVLPKGISKVMKANLMSQDNTFDEGRGKLLTTFVTPSGNVNVKRTPLITMPDIPAFAAFKEKYQITVE